MGVTAERRPASEGVCPGCVLCVHEGVCLCWVLRALPVRGRSGTPSMGVNLKPGVVAVVMEPHEEVARPAAEGVLDRVIHSGTPASGVPD